MTRTPLLTVTLDHQHPHAEPSWFCATVIAALFVATLAVLVAS